ncbi:MAG: hypothetical protein IPJ02_01915 [Chitinophagaceae bacterium]|nr:hypothetical protein [Chitinophagaceae bacterium]
MKKVILVIVVAGTGIFSSCAQVTCKFSKAYAYFTVSMPGTQMVDEKGNPVPPVPVIERFIYIETTGPAIPKVVFVRYDTLLMKATVARIEGNTSSPGNNPENYKPVILKAKKGNHLWRIDLQPAEESPMKATAYRNIHVKILRSGRSCVLRFKAEKELSTFPRY